MGVAPLKGFWKTAFVGLWGTVSHLWHTVSHLWHSRRRLMVILIACGTLAFAGVVVLTYELLKRPPDIHNSKVAFEPQKPPKPLKAKTVNWPIFGLNAARTRYLPAKGVKPPYRLLWHYSGRPLLEFPPVYANGRLYFINNNGYAFALNANTGKVLWERRLGVLNASSPAYYKNRVYIVNLVPGHIVKLNAITGKTIWKRALPGRAESSPLVLGNTVYFGCESDQLFALNTSNGHTRWVTTLAGPVKSAPAFHHGILFVGDYGGDMNAVNAKTGAIKWQTASLGQGFGTSGEFYSTPAVAFGRVYAGNNDDRVYSFDEKTGEIAWSFSTGGYVYSGPTVASTQNTPPTVYIGSFDGNIYALNAKTGEPRWQRSAGGQVVGSLSAVGNIVYVAEFTNGSTNGYLMKNGRQVFHYKTGTYSPVISDGQRIYLVGYSSINALQPYKYKAAVSAGVKAPPGPPAPPPSAARSKQHGGARPASH